ncbi:MAG TPA: hypothetical protein VIY28_03720 [Pseudonocardiaceae bacterium]
MAKRHRTTPLLHLLSRLGWQRDPDLWTVHCRDGHGHRARILVHLSAAGVCLTVPDHSPLQLSALQAGQLRAGLRDALLSLERLVGPDGLSTWAESQRTSPQRRRRSVSRAPASASQYGSLPDPSVAELRLREH